MNLMPHTITPRTPLTVTELETLAVMLDSGSRRMITAKNDDGQDTWPTPGGIFAATITDMFSGFFEIRDNAAILAVGPHGWPYDAPHAHITITAAA